MQNYAITPSDIEKGIQRVLAEAYISSTVSSDPTLVFITAGPGAGKTSMESYLKRAFGGKGERPFVLNSDKIATYHPYYEDLLDELPEECYRMTRQFVKPATPIIFEELMKHKVSIINEKVFSRVETDIELARKFKESGYRIIVDIIATDLYESRIACYQRDAAMLLAGLKPRSCSRETQERMYNSFIPGVQRLQELGISDEINVFVRGENISKPPKLRYSTHGEPMEYSSFYEAIISERAKQRQQILSNPLEYLSRIADTKKTISEYGTNESLINEAISALDELQEDFIRELGKREEMPR